MYLSSAFEAPVSHPGPIPVIEPSFAGYLKATYQLNTGIRCISI